MFGEEYLPESLVSDVDFARDWASAVAPASPIVLTGQCAVVVVEAGTDNTYSILCFSVGVTSRLVLCAASGSC